MVVMQYSIIKLKPESPFHIGEKGVGLEETSNIIHSDTLFSAICNAFRLLYGNEELKEMLELFKVNDPPFLLSSAFLYSDDVLVFPLPLCINWKRYVDNELIDGLNTGREEKEKIDKFDLLKKMKKVKFISKRIFDDVIKDETKIKEYINDKNIKQGILFSENELEKLKVDIFYKKTETPRVTLDRRSHASNIYYFGEVLFSEKCGLYFLIDFKCNEELKSKIKASIRLLGDEGVGGDRTSGKGLFKPIFENNLKLETTNTNTFLTLSLTYPLNSELKPIKEGFYELIMRRGWIYSLNQTNLRKKTIMMLTEGSVFRGTVVGKIVDVTPDIMRNRESHPVYRYGYSFLVPCEVGE